MNKNRETELQNERVLIMIIMRSSIQSEFRLSGISSGNEPSINSPKQNFPSACVFKFQMNESTI